MCSKDLNEPILGVCGKFSVFVGNYLLSKAE
jgi:hypothetical protein